MMFVEVQKTLAALKPITQRPELQLQHGEKGFLKKYVGKQVH